MTIIYEEGDMVMRWMQRTKWWLVGMAAVALYAVPPAVLSVSAYSGGFYDDGLYDDDWYFDYYEGKDSGKLEGADSKSFEGKEEYRASQLYEDAGESGFFKSSNEPSMKKAGQERQADRQ